MRNPEKLLVSIVFLLNALLVAQPTIAQNVTGEPCQTREIQELISNFASGCEYDEDTLHVYVGGAAPILGGTLPDFDPGRQGSFNTPLLNEQLMGDGVVDDGEHEYDRTEERLWIKSAGGNLELYLRVAAAVYADESQQHFVLRFYEVYGYCSYAIFIVEFRIHDGLLQMRGEPGGSVSLQCMIDFDAIRTYEASIAASASKLGIDSSSNLVLDSSNLSDAIHDAIFQLKSVVPTTSVFTRETVHQNHAFLTVEGMRGAVLGGLNYWERLEVAIFAFEIDQSTVRLHVIIDGYFGSGLAQPSLHGYDSMQPTYSEDMLRFTQRLKDLLEGQ
jgi:hypothetical protein